MNNQSISPTGGSGSFSPVGSRKQSDTSASKRDFKKILDSDADESHDQGGEAVEGRAGKGEPPQARLTP